MLPFFMLRAALYSIRIADALPDDIRHAMLIFRYFAILCQHYFTICHISYTFRLHFSSYFFSSSFTIANITIIHTVIYTLSDVY